MWYWGDYAPRQNQIGFLESEVHGGVTTFISAGEVHLAGRPKDPAGTKALAILAAKSFNNFRPGGGKVIGGAVILEKGLTREDFEEMAREGVRVVGEIGLGSVKDPADAAPMVKWAREMGMTVMMHTGGTSIPGSSTVTAEMVIQTDPHIASHINGGPTAVAIDEVKKLVNETGLALEIVHCGNPKVAVEAANLCVEVGALDRVIIGNDAPSGTGRYSPGHPSGDQPSGLPDIRQTGGSHLYGHGQHGPALQAEPGHHCQGYGWGSGDHGCPHGIRGG